MRLLSIAMLVLCLSAAGAAEATWSTDYAASLAQAKEAKKLLLVNFSGSDWCGWCIKLDEEVFSTEAFAAWVKDRFILVNLDFPRRKGQDAAVKERNRKLMGDFGVEGFPTVLFIDGEGKVVAKSGYVEGGPEAWIKATEGLLPVAVDDVKKM
jgi:protein disulfide-isomerase